MARANEFRCHVVNNLNNMARSCCFDMVNDEKHKVINRNQNKQGKKKNNRRLVRPYSKPMISSLLIVLFTCSLLSVVQVRGLVIHQKWGVPRFPSNSLHQRSHTKYRRPRRPTPNIPKQLFSEPPTPGSNRDTPFQDDKPTLKRLFQDFCFGANLVHSQYLSFLWKYSIVQSLHVTIPIAILLWSCRFLNPAVGKSVYDLIYFPLFFMWNLSSGVASVLQLPLEALRWTFASFPALMIGLLEHLPNVLAVPMVQAVLLGRDTFSWISVMASNNQVASFLTSVTAVLVWRPAVEELEYRSILNKFFFAPRFFQTKFKKRQSSSLDVPVVEFIPMDNSTYMPSSFTKKDGDEMDKRPSAPQNRSILLPLANESNRILVGSILFATTRLGWLSWDPVAGDHASPYSWTIGFVQSIMAHFSSQMLPQVRPGLQIWVLLLAIYQTVGTFLMAQNIFANLYRERGLVASVGAHVTWTISKGTIPIRLLWKLWTWCASVTGLSVETGKMSGSTQKKASEMLQRRQG